MGWLWALCAGCAPGWVEIGGAREPLRTALLLADGDRQQLLMSNSDTPCLPDGTDRPGTSQDEEAIASSWWLAQLRTALTREGTIVVRVSLPGRGAWSVGPDPAQSPATALWYRVVEAEAIDQRDLETQYLPTEVETGGGSGAVTLEVEGAGELTLDDGLSAAFSAAPCDNAALPALAAAALLELQAQAP